MILKIAASVVLLGSCAIASFAGQSVAQPAVNVAGSIKVPRLSSLNAQAQAFSIRGPGLSDEVMPMSCVALVTALSIEKNVVTFYGDNQLAPSQEIQLVKLNRAGYLNNVRLKVTSATPKSFTVSFPHPDVALIHDGGTAIRTDCPAKADFQSEQKVEVFHNNLNYYQRHLSSNLSAFTFDQFFPLEQDAQHTSLIANQPGYSWGNNGGWSVMKNHFDDLTFNSRGIAQANNIRCVKHATGDVACGDYVYGSTDGGSTAQSDEGFTVDTREGGETDSYFHGTVGGGATRGATVLPVTFTAGQDATTDGAFLLDISKGRFAGTVTGLDGIVDGTSVHTLPVNFSGAEPPSPSTGIGIIRTPIPILVQANVPESVTLEVRLTQGSFKTGTACLAGGWYPEQVEVTAVKPPTGQTQEVTVMHKNPNPTAETDRNNPSSLWQGGLCGNYLSLDRNLERDGFRTSYPVVGATDAHHIAYVWNVNGQVRQNNVNVYSAPTPLVKLVRKDGTVTANFARANATILYNRVPESVIAESSDASFNGAIASPQYGPNGTVSWKQAGADATSAAATIDLPAKSYGFHLYPGAEILGPRTEKGVPLEPNSVAWAAGDTIENPHNPSFLMRFRMSLVTQHTPPSGADSSGDLWMFRGAGISANFRPSRWINENPCKLYIGCGGTLQPITWTIHRGPYSILHRVDNAPMNGGILFRIGCDPAGCDHPVPYALFELQNGRIGYDPATGTVSTRGFQAEGITSGWLKTDSLSLTKMPDGCVGVVGHVLASGVQKGHEAPCLSAIHWKGGSGLTVQQSGDPASPTFTIVPEPGFYIPRGDKISSGTTSTTPDAAATIVAGEANRRGSVGCAGGYQCTSSRGRISITATGATVGKVARVNVRLAAGEICTATQNGGTAFFGIGSGGESATGFDVTSGVALTGRVLVDYFCR